MKVGYQYINAFKLIGRIDKQVCPSGGVWCFIIASDGFQHPAGGAAGGDYAAILWPGACYFPAGLFRTLVILFVHTVFSDVFYLNGQKGA